MVKGKHHGPGAGRPGDRHGEERPGRGQAGEAAHHRQARPRGWRRTCGALPPATAAQSRPPAPDSDDDNNNNDDFFVADKCGGSPGPPGRDAAKGDPARGKTLPRTGRRRGNSVPSGLCPTHMPARAHAGDDARMR